MTTIHGSQGASPPAPLSLFGSGAKPSSTDAPASGQPQWLAAADAKPLPDEVMERAHPRPDTDGKGAKAFQMYLDVLARGVELRERLIANYESGIAHLRAHATMDAATEKDMMASAATSLSQMRAGLEAARQNYLAYVERLEHQQVLWAGQDVGVDSAPIDMTV